VRGQTARTPERVAEAQRLRAAGKTYREIGEALGVSLKTAFGWITDPDGSARRERQAKFDLVCVECGGRVAGGSRHQLIDIEEPVCRRCAGDHYAIWTREAIVCAIQEWADEHGGIPPSSTHWKAARVRGDDRVTSVSSVLRRFGTWNAAIQAAGFEPHAGGPVGGVTPLTEDQRAECARRYAAGESSVVIAADLGCTPHTVTKWARREGVSIRAPFHRKAAA
jgi:DNA-binding CsgD family transcriptional regulator